MGLIHRTLLIYINILDQFLGVLVGNSSSHSLAPKAHYFFPFFGLFSFFLVFRHNGIGHSIIRIGTHGPPTIVIVPSIEQLQASLTFFGNGSFFCNTIFSMSSIILPYFNDQTFIDTELC